MEVLGDPLSLANNLGAGVVQFYTQTRAEVIGDSRTRGEGLKRLARAVVGGAAGSTSKMTGSLAELIRVLAGHDDGIFVPYSMFQNSGATDAVAVNKYGALDRLKEKDPDIPQFNDASSDAPGQSIESIDDLLILSQPSRGVSVSSGVRQGGDVIANAVVAGLSSLVEEPSKGLHESGVLGAAKGLVRGIVKAVSAPLMGALGAVSVVTESVELSTRYAHGVPVGRRRLGQSEKNHPLSRNTSMNSTATGDSVAIKEAHSGMETYTFQQEGIESKDIPRTHSTGRKSVDVVNLAIRKHDRADFFDGADFIGIDPVYLQQVKAANRAKLRKKK
jgi:hypothetical protein